MAFSEKTEFARLLAIYVKRAQLEKGNGKFLENLTAAEMTDITKQARAAVKVKMEKEAVECVERQTEYRERTAAQAKKTKKIVKANKRASKKRIT